MELDDSELLRARDEFLGAQSGPSPSSSRLWRDSIVAAVGLAVAGVGCFWLILLFIESRIPDKLRGTQPPEAGMTAVVGVCVFVAGVALLAVARCSRHGEIRWASCWCHECVAESLSCDGGILYDRRIEQQGPRASG